jgi:hypothetical protein
MKRTGNIRDEALDRLLDEHLAGSSEEIEPSSGFAFSVMEAIHAEAAEPPPIAFPWRRVLPGLSMIVCGLVAILVLALRVGKPGATGTTAIPNHVPDALSMTHLFTATIPSFTVGEMMLGWILLAVCLSVAAVAASFRITGRSQ